MAQSVKNLSDYDGNHDASAVVRPPLLVECPECKTTFTVSRAAISQGGQPTTEPTFHCSRCDNVFSVLFSELKESKAPPQLSRPPSPTRLTPIARPLNSKDSTQTSLFDLPSQIRNQTNWGTESIQLKDVGFIKSSPLPEAPSTPRIRSTVVTTQPQNQESTAHTNNRQSIFRVSAMFNIRERYLKANGVSLVVVPVVSFLLVLGLASTALVAGGSPREALAWMLPEQDNSLATSVVLRNVAIKTVSLDNGEQVRVVSGKIYNGTGTSLERVDLEAAVFNKRGDRLVAQRVSAASSVSKSKVKSLTIDMIKEIQRGGRTKSLKLRPGEESPFSVVLTNSTGARFFTTRVYSAKAVEG